MINMMNQKDFSEMRRASYALAREKFDVRKNVAQLKAVMEKYI